MCFMTFQGKEGDEDEWNKVGEMLVSITVKMGLY